eukprot:378822-Pleurochrysis_carterae.AAC.1
MSAANATYDVLWGVPDGEGLQCARAGAPAYLPECVNTSFPGYAGNWSMASTRGNSAGLRAATSFDQSQFGVYTYPYAVWTLEVAFPMRGGRDAGARRALRRATRGHSLIRYWLRQRRMLQAFVGGLQCSRRVAPAVHLASIAGNGFATVVTPRQMMSIPVIYALR